MEYIIILIICCGCAIKNKRMAYSLRIFWLVVICTYMILVIGLRYRVGIDTLNYMQSYEQVPNIETYLQRFSWKDVRDPLYNILSALFKTCTKEFWPFQLFMASITTICIIKFLKRTCINPFIGLIVFLIVQWLYFTTEIIRESAAISIFLLNYRNIQKKQYLKYYLYSLLSIGFHYSAVITWIFPFCRKLRFNLAYILLCLAIVVSTPLLDNINQLLAIASVMDRVDQYIEGADNLNFNWKIAELIKNNPHMQIQAHTHTF